MVALPSYTANIFRYDKRAANYRAGVVLASLVLWLPA
jgi:hypothetical protein